ncbi:MAG: DinB family protein [Ginsengibacter sp.]
MDQRNFEQSLLILENFDFDNTIHYANTKGEAFNNSVRDILFHIINHSTYHRGQIAASFRVQGLEPLVSDYVFYKR